MNIKNIAILTTRTSWFYPHAEQLKLLLKNMGYAAELFSNHEDISDQYKVVFILSYFKIIPEKFLDEHTHNLVVHESDLPEGKGWSPLSWQILEGKNRIPISLFEAAKDVDAGDIYLKDEIVLNGDELNEEIHALQSKKTIEMCLSFLENYNNLKSQQQQGEETFYDRRRPADSELDIEKSIKEQFNLMRIASNEEYPLFFNINGQKYILKIHKE
jgi:methionyl-tRNA formyltransferase